MAARPEDPPREGASETTPADVEQNPPKSLGKPGDYEETKEAKDAKARLLGSVIALIAIDLILGTWAFFNAKGVFAVLAIANFSAFGASGVSKLLPKSQRDELKEKYLGAGRRYLSSAYPPRILGVVAGLLLLASFFVATVHVKNTGAATAIRVVRGSKSTSDTNAINGASTIQLEADDGAVRLRLIRPRGQAVWAYARTSVSRGDRIARPWRPVRWSYPADFDEQVTLVVLPTTFAIPGLVNQPPELVVRDSTGTQLVRSSLTGDGARIRFFETPVDPEQLGSLAAAEYRKKLATGDSLALATGSITRDEAIDPRDLDGMVAGRIAAWRAAITLKPSRPLHLGEKVRYEFDRQGRKAGPFELTLDKNPYLLFIDSTMVDTPES